MGACAECPVFDRATAADVAQLMDWFRDAASTRAWGGPFFRHPFDADSFREDLRWPGMSSWVDRAAVGTVLAFGQYYERYGRMNLARLAVRPDCRGQGQGRRFITRLMGAAQAELGLTQFSLFVYSTNLPALHCYQALGFREAQYPEGAPLAGEAIYLTRPAEVRPD